MRRPFNAGRTGSACSAGTTRTSSSSTMKASVPDRRRSMRLSGSFVALIPEQMGSDPCLTLRPAEDGVRPVSDPKAIRMGSDPCLTLRPANDGVRPVSDPKDPCLTPRLQAVDPVTTGLADLIHHVPVRSTG